MSLLCGLSYLSHSASYEHVCGLQYLSHSGSCDPVCGLPISHIPLAMSLLCGLSYLSHSASYEPVCGLPYLSHSSHVPHQSYVFQLMDDWWCARKWWYSFVTSALDGSERSAANLGRFTPAESPPYTLIVLWCNTFLYLQLLYVLKNILNIYRQRVTPFLKFFFLWRCDPTRVMTSSFTRFSRSHATAHHSR